MPRANQNHLHYLTQLKKRTSIYDRHSIIQSFSIICCWLAIFNLLYTTQPILASVLSAAAFLIHGFVQRIEILFSQQLEESLTLVNNNEAGIAKRAQVAALMAQNIKSLGGTTHEDDNILYSELDSSLISTKQVEDAFQQCKINGDHTLDLTSCVAVLDFPLTYESYAQSTPSQVAKLCGLQNERVTWIKRFNSGADNNSWKKKDRKLIAKLLRGEDNIEKSLPCTDPYPKKSLGLFSAIHKSIYDFDHTPHSLTI